MRRGYQSLEGGRKGPHRCHVCFGQSKDLQLFGRQSGVRIPIWFFRERRDGDLSEPETGRNQLVPRGVFHKFQNFLVESLVETFY